MDKAVVGGIDAVILQELSRVIDLLKGRLPLARLKVRVLYVVYSNLGKRVSYVRPCFECCSVETDGLVVV